MQGTKSKTKPYTVFLGNIAKDFTIDNMRRSALKGYVYAFSVDYNIIDIKEYQKYLIKMT